MYSLFEAYQVPLNTITLKFSVDEISLDIDTAILCGLILNELVSNCLKYAFPMDGSNKVHIIFRSADSQGLTLIVRDNGIGFPNDLDFRETKSLGLQLVCTLTEQLAGTITLDRDNGTTFQITFSAKDQPIKSSLELLENED